MAAAKKAAKKPVPGKKGEGFNKASANIAHREGISPSRADAILAASTRKASPKARRANPNLKKVPMKKKG